jgi:hypothetical protein
MWCGVPRHSHNQGCPCKPERGMCRVHCRAGARHVSCVHSHARPHTTFLMAVRPSGNQGGPHTPFGHSSVGPSLGVPPASCWAISSHTPGRCHSETVQGLHSHGVQGWYWAFQSRADAMSVCRRGAFAPFRRLAQLHTSWTVNTALCRALLHHERLLLQHAPLPAHTPQSLPPPLAALPSQPTETATKQVHSARAPDLQPDINHSTLTGL